MKQVDIRRLEKTVKLYRKIEDILDKAYESIHKQPEEFVNFGQKKTYEEVEDMLKSAILERKWMEGKINAFKEL